MRSGAWGYSHVLDSLTKARAPEGLVEPSRHLEAQPPADAHAVGPWPMTLARFLTLVGLLASGVTGLIHQAGDRSVKMCRSLTPTNCETVIVSQYGSIVGVPLPVVGLVGFGVSPSRACAQWHRKTRPRSPTAAGAVQDLRSPIQAAARTCFPIIPSAGMAFRHLDANSITAIVAVRNRDPSPRSLLERTGKMLCVLSRGGRGS